MIYGKITLEDWRTVCVEGEEPESSFETLLSKEITP